MKHKTTKEIRKALFRDANNKEEILENCNKILDARTSYDSKVDDGYKHTRRIFAIVSAACLLVIVALAMIILIPPMFKSDSGEEGDGTYYFHQSEFKKETVKDINIFIKENKLSFKILQLSNNLVNSNCAYYYNDTFVGLEQELFVLKDESCDMGILFIYPSNYIIDKYEEVVYNKVEIDGITVQYVEYPIAGEYLSQFLFSFEGNKYYYEINSDKSINIEDYVKKIVE